MNVSFHLRTRVRQFVSQIRAAVLDNKHLFCALAGYKGIGNHAPGGMSRSSFV